MVVESGLCVRVEILHALAKQHLRICRVPANGATPLHFLDEHARKYLLLLVDDGSFHLQFIQITTPLPSPYVLRVEVGVTRCEFGRQVCGIPLKIVFNGLSLWNPRQILWLDAGVFARGQLGAGILGLHRIVRHFRCYGLLCLLCHN